VACDQLLDLTAEPARVDRSGIKLPGGIRSEQQTNEHPGEVGVLGVALATIGQVVEHRSELGHDLFVQRRQTLAQLRATEGRDADLREEHAAVPIGGVLDEEEIQSARERALGVEHVELGAERRACVLDDLIDGCDQEVLLRDEVMVHEPGRELRLGGNALHRGVGDSVLQNRSAQARDDLATARTRETRSSHR
jgi:hypothetical protein